MIEASNALMNYRWWLLQTLTKHRVDYSIVAALLVGSYVWRLVTLGYLMLFYIFPKYSLFMAEKQVFWYLLMVAGHGIILVLSAHWLKLLVRGGLKRTLTYNATLKTPMASRDP